MEEICLCGHLKSEHKGWEYEPTGCQGEDGSVVGGICECSEFKLDNLRFIEDEAKKRKLIN